MEGLKLVSILLACAQVHHLEDGRSAPSVGRRHGRRQEHIKRKEKKRTEKPGSQAKGKFDMLKGRQPGAEVHSVMIYLNLIWVVEENPSPTSEQWILFFAAILSRTQLVCCNVSRLVGELSSVCSWHDAYIFGELLLSIYILFWTCR